MEIFIIISVLVPVIAYIVLPRLVLHFNGEPEKCQKLLMAACALFFVSWYLPSPLIDGENTSFVTHFVGGGLFTGLVWLYLKFSLNWRAKWWLEGFSLFALVSALGCINEIFELLLVRAQVANILITDTSWDIFANSLGALAVYLGYLLHDSRH